MRCLVTGCGSIGSRRARLLVEMGHTVMCHDADTDRAVELYHALGPNAKASLGGNVWTGAEDGYDAVFVCTPAATHLGVMREALPYLNERSGLFVEKPLSLSMDGISWLLADLGDTRLVTMGACNMRWAYRAMPDPGRQTLVLVVSRPLSEWRAGAEDAYRANGIVLEMAIHEMDLAFAEHGEIVGLAVRGDVGNVGIGLEHRDRTASYIHALWEEGGATTRHASFDSGLRGPNQWATVYEPDTSDEMYRLEMQHFLDCVKEGRETCNPLRSAAHVLEWAIKAQSQIREGVTM